MRITFLSIMAFLMAFSFVSCGGDDNGGSGKDKFECTVDGKAHKISGKYAWATFVGSGNDLFAIYGSEDQTNTSGFTNVYISFSGGKPAVGTHKMGTGEKASGNWINTADSKLFNTALTGGSGSVEITEITDDRIKGTFSFVAADASGATKKVENGTFDVRIGFE